MTAKVQASCKLEQVFQPDSQVAKFSNKPKCHHALRKVISTYEQCSLGIPLCVGFGNTDYTKLPPLELSCAGGFPSSLLEAIKAMPKPNTQAQ